MNAFKDISYVSRNGLRAGVSHPQDDPYVGKPKSSIAIAVMRDRPIGIAWMYDGKAVIRSFDHVIQAAVDRKSDLLVVIGHNGSPIGEYDLPSNGVVFHADGSVHRRIVVPPRITRTDVENVLAPGSKRVLVPEALVAVDGSKGVIEISLAYLDGYWDETRRYDPLSGVWGETTGQYRSL